MLLGRRELSKEEFNVKLEGNKLVSTMQLWDEDKRHESSTGKTIIAFTTSGFVKVVDNPKYSISVTVIAKKPKKED